METSRNILAPLNSAQNKVVKSIDGKYLVIGGAGTGKTTTLLSRIYYLRTLGIDSSDILMLSNDKIVNNSILKDKIDSVDIKITSLHSFSLSILLTNQSLLDWNKNITVIDDEKSLSIIKNVYHSVNGYSIDLEEAKDYKDYIESYQKRGETPKNGDLDFQYEKSFIDVYHEYQKYKRQNSYIDFHDIVNVTLSLFEKFPHFRDYYSKKYKYIIVDRTEDLTIIGFKLLKLLSNFHENIMFAFDDNQSIYNYNNNYFSDEWNDNLHALVKDKEFEVIYLEQNYRSSQMIVGAANSLIKYHQNQLNKEMYSKKITGEPIFVQGNSDEVKEAKFVAEKIKSLVNKSKYTYDDIMILYRSHSKSSTLEIELHNAGIPYSTIGRTEFYAKEDIKNLVFYLRAFDNPDDNLSVKHIINVFTTGIDSKTLDEIYIYANQAKLSLFRTLKNIKNISKFNKHTRLELLKVVKLIKWGSKYIQKKNATIEDIIFQTLKETGYMRQFDAFNKAHDERISLIQTLHQMVREFDKLEKENFNDDGKIVRKFLKDKSLYMNQNNETYSSKVQLSTVHASKGLESNVVFIYGLNNGSFPSSLATSTYEKKEERRLFYLAMTRAKELLFLTYPETYYINDPVESYYHGNIGSYSPSLYITEIPKKFIHSVN